MAGVIFIWANLTRLTSSPVHFPRPLGGNGGPANAVTLHAATLKITALQKGVIISRRGD